MSDTLTLGLAQINPTVGDVAGNLAKIRQARAESASDLLVCSELSLVGYPPEDLVLRPAVIEATRHAVEELARDTVSGAAVLATAPWQVGGQDELVFDGGSFVVNRDERLVVRLPVWKEVVQPVRWNRSGGGWSCVTESLAAVPSDPQNTYQALMLGLRDYVTKNRFPGILLGLSGAIDSAWTAAIAVDALGADHVRGVRLPSRFTSRESQDDAEIEARRLGIHLDTIPIGGVVDAIEQTPAPIFAGRERDITEENIQARARGLLLMAVSNKVGAMLLTTGNKSEMSVGYATLYGDMCGGYSVLKDLYKTEAYALAA